MFSTNVLIAILEWLHSKFQQAANKQHAIAVAHADQIKQLAYLKLVAEEEKNRASAFADKIANFLE